MTDLKINSFLTQRILEITCIIFSGFCWYFSNGLTGDFWYLLWIAPIPVLIISLNSTVKRTFIISFIAYLVGRLSWFSYLVTVASAVPAIIFTLALPLIFAMIIIITRLVVIKTNSWYAVFAFPVFFTAYEFLLIKLSPDGTAGSIAYSQSNLLPIIQIASVTGILGITFIVTFIPSAISVGWYYRRQKTKLRYVTVAAVFIIISVFLFGILRMSNDSKENTAVVGLAVLDEKLHDMSNHPDFENAKLVAEDYSRTIADLAARGAGVIVLPERAINMNKETAPGMIKMLSNTAKSNHVLIVTGYTNFRNDPERNSALVIDAGGNVVRDYNKVHLVKGLEDQFTPGTEAGLFKVGGMQAGAAICKDLDFPDYIKEYGKNKVSPLYIPAWDFVIDDWLHSRMSILRGVENGFSEVRAARQGRLTISDCYGRVTYEANASKGLSTVLLGKVSLKRSDTIYSHFGDWFGIVNLIAAMCFILLEARNKRKTILLKKLK